MEKVIIFDQNFLGDPTEIISASYRYFSDLLDMVAETLQVENFSEEQKNRFLYGGFLKNFFLKPYNDFGTLDSFKSDLSAFFDVGAENPYFEDAAQNILKFDNSNYQAVNFERADFIIRLKNQCDLYHHGSHDGREASILYAVSECPNFLDAGIEAMTKSRAVYSVSYDDIYIKEFNEEEFLATVGIDTLKDAYFVTDDPEKLSLLFTQGFSGALFSSNDSLAELKKKILNFLYDDDYVAVAGVRHTIFVSFDI